MEFGIQAHVGFKPGNEHRLPTVKGFLKWRQEPRE
jgi:hypothetical protein